MVAEEVEAIAAVPSFNLSEALSRSDLQSPKRRDFACLKIIL
jgi:hypothetical protein